MLERDFPVRWITSGSRKNVFCIVKPIGLLIDAGKYIEVLLRNHGDLYLVKCQ